jgi:uncharacterized membrane protein YdfJ with MMPL/SSD domain
VRRVDPVISTDLTAPRLEKGRGSDAADRSKRTTFRHISRTQRNLPIVAFAVLFGLSIDYEVFVLARVREEYDRTGSTDTDVAGALARTGRLVTGGATILAISFLSLATNPNILVRIVATTLSTGMIVDAVVIRTLLVPALVALMGRWNWWMPAVLARTLRIPPTPPARDLATATLKRLIGKERTGNALTAIGGSPMTFT